MIPIVILGVVLLVALGGSSKGGTTPGGTSTPGGGTTPGAGNKPGGTGKPSTPKPTPTPTPTKPPKGYVWGNPGALPDWFDAEANSFWISPDCDAVAEGELFEPYGRIVSFEAAEGSTLSETLNGTQYGKKNSVWGFIDYLIDWEGYVDPQEIALRIVMEENALCRDLGPDYWPTPLASWFDDFVSRITPGVIERTGGIQFG